MNRADIELLNRSMGDLGQSFLENRKMDAAVNERELDRQLKQQMLDETVAQRRENTDARNQHFKAEEQHYRNIEGQMAATQAQKQQELLARAKDHVNKTWTETTKWFGEQVKDGLMKPIAAQNAVQKAFQAMPQESQQMLADHPAVLAMQSGDFAWQEPTDKIHPPADVATDREATRMEDEAKSESDLTSTDRQSLLSRAKALRSGIGKGVTMTSGTTLDEMGQPKSHTSFSGPVDQVTAAMGSAPGGPAPAVPMTPGAAASPSSAKPVTRYVRDPKTGKLVPAPTTPAPQPFGQ